MRRVFQVLNEPFILWLLSSVVVGFVSWQYSEIRRDITTREVNEQALRKAKLELKLQAKDVQFAVEQRENLTMAQLAGVHKMLQYTGLGQGSDYFVPGIPNVMLEIDSRTGACGLDKYQDRIYKQATTLGAALSRLWGMGAPPTARVYAKLSPPTLSGLDETVVLVAEIRSYYAQKTPDCEAGR